MPVGHHAVHGLAVMVSGWRVVLENQVAELIEDSQLKAVLHEEREDVLNGQSVLHILLGFPNGLQDARSVDHVSFFISLQKVIAIEVIDAINEALVLRVILLANCVFEGARFKVYFGGGVAVEGR